MQDRACVPKDFGNEGLWQKLLEKWLDLVKAYESDDSDLAYWYGERPLTGLLGASAWIIGGWSLEEFGAHRERKKTGVIGHARGDLWLGCDCVGATGAATVEAKICWIDCDEIDAAKAQVVAKLDEARKQLKQLDEDNREGQPVSVCYVVPCYTGNDGRAKGYQLLEMLEESVKKKLATANHHTKKKDVTDDEDKERAKYPGVILVARRETVWER